MNKFQKAQSSIKAILFLICLNSCTREFTNECDSKSINYKPLKANFTMTRDGNVVTLFNNSDNAQNFEWKFSDGTKSNEENLQKTVTGAKPLEIKLIALSCGNSKKDSLSQTIDMNCSQLAPTISYAAGTSLILCGTSSIRLTASACAVGTPLWSNGATTASMDVNVAGNYTVRCQGSCQTASSLPVVIKSATNATIETVAGSNVTNLKVFDLTLNGTINFNSGTSLSQVKDHGFIYQEGTVDPNTTKTGIKESLKGITGTQKLNFKTILKAKSTNRYSYRAYIQNCDNSIIYGNIKYTN